MLTIYPHRDPHRFLLIFPQTGIRQKRSIPCKDVGYDNYDFPYSWKPSNGISCPNPLSTDGSGAPEQVRFCLQCLILRLEHQTECLVLMPSPIQFLRSLWNAFPCLFPDAVDRSHGRLVCSCDTALCAMPCVLTKKIFLTPGSSHYLFLDSIIL